MYKNTHRAFKKGDKVKYNESFYHIKTLYPNIDKVMLEQNVNGKPMKTLVDIKEINHV